MSINIITIGKKHEPWITEGLDRYQKRLQKPYDVKWVLLPHSSLEGTQARQEESERIVQKLGKAEYVVLLDEIGKNLSSPELGAMLDTQFGRGSVTLVIGGAYGVTRELQQRADLVWSLSRLVFPHQLVRLLLIEQLYRAQEIQKGGKYHHI
ncbi:23S rRNA (pseudouridine(1915)-N(3))-methyltransferase RlmH [Candidatus Mycosynbacter amalyticus]|uniref:23S rRNA (pseudouridine(1915)-N(3))-methyltransferase RlmH n=1 Tax=Candidatus Mycosynbacter amalyticus TaxID=2665156 RepID=UPI0021B3B745|nr:23S rRNA (pseudouridine(1915)-N(3))-methyltransferase RlmH [Candidatus Mycosynbacter amalyticus]